MFAALAPLLIFVGFDGVAHGVARTAFHQGKLSLFLIKRDLSFKVARAGLFTHSRTHTHTHMLE